MGTQTESVRFAVLFSSPGGHAVVPLRSRRDPDAVSVQIALDRIFNRTMALLVMVLLTGTFATLAGAGVLRKI